MCMNTSYWNSLHSSSTTVCRHRQSRGRNFRVHRLDSRKQRLWKEAKEKARVDMLIKNFKLYMENKSIIEENELLRKKANLLHQENSVLLSQLQKISDSHKEFAHNNK